MGQVVNPPTTVIPRAHTIQEVAATLRCSDAYVRKLIRDGVLPAVKVGRFVRVRPEAVERFLAGEVADKSA